MRKKVVLEITKTKEGTSLTIAVSGRINTTTAPELEAAVLSDLEGVEKLVFDFADLDYISSAGLRILLAALNAMGDGEMVVRNVNDEVMDVFDVTGFVDVLTIE